MKTVIALDLGTTTGFAVKSPHGLSSGTLSFKKKGKFHVAGFKALYDFLYTFLEGQSPSSPSLEIAVECPHAGRFIAPVRILFGLLAVVHLFCDQFRIKITEYKPKEIKKYWTGKGNADKDMMVAETQKKFPNIKDHNQSDAVALLYLHLSKG